ncbi:leucyl aminopeptidase [Mesorhizobium sp. RP14(2022)]|uniref:Probable cytosol aminopeptidase n=1 Tax=Mesorhizobium liriopis TaxID=2953882 RepID=A0ABT1C8U0_9HYPH|nr:leucyl aminopeptidase [Mesorhizobium liriopis]MCO6050918.1 leucyl aminopeptidase [Mesorhizobium liriopis]
MAQLPTIAFASSPAPQSGSVIVLAGDGGALSAEGRAADGSGALRRASGVAEFSGKFGAVLELIAPVENGPDRLIAIGTGKADALNDHAWLKLGGVAGSQLRKGAKISIVASVEGVDVSAEDAAQLAAGILLRAYSFDKYKTRKDEGEKADGAKSGEAASVTIHVSDAAAAERAFAAVRAVAEGVHLARDLVNEPANHLGPLELSGHAEALREFGVEVEVLTEEEMHELGMGALLGVSRGSTQPGRLAVMQWKGGGDEKPVAFVGKGVVFDTGGNSMKPAAGMEDMKGDMGGAAAVLGLMRALAGRKAKANVVGVIGCVENMVSGDAQRPGDIVSSMSGQTIEVLNTDAEGRLVLADALWYTNDRFQPQLMIDLATLTGAILVALGQLHAGLFSNDDELAQRLTAAGLATDERVWRMPMGPDYDKLIDSKNADMKNIGGRYGGSITAAQFLKRFVKDTPWAHLDIAGTAMGSPSNEINQSWGSGFGVRLLDRFVADNYETAKNTA